MTLLGEWLLEVMSEFPDDRGIFRLKNTYKHVKKYEDSVQGK